MKLTTLITGALAATALVAATGVSAMAKPPAGSEGVTWYVYGDISSSSNIVQVTKQGPGFRGITESDTCTKGANPNFCDGNYKDYSRAGIGEPWYPTS